MVRFYCKGLGTDCVCTMCLQRYTDVCVSAGVNSSVKFYCEAKNARGISVSRTGTIHIKGEFACWTVTWMERYRYAWSWILNLQ